MTPHDRLHQQEKRVVIALMIHLEEPPRFCGECLFTRDIHSQCGQTSCYFKPLPVALAAKGCKADFFLRHLLEKL